MHVVDNVVLPQGILEEYQDCDHNNLAFIEKEVSLPTLVARTAEFPAQQVPNPPPPSSTPTPQSPSCTKDQCCTVYQIIKQRPDLTLFTEFVDYSNLTSFLDTKMDFTLFAPNNEGMTSYLNISDTIDFDYDDDYMHALVRYHIVEGIWPTALMRSKNFKLKSLLGTNEYLMLETDQAKVLFAQGTNWNVIGKYNNASIVESDIHACGAVIHVLDSPLLYIPE
eukprot:TRINITY_DN16390_c0_g1_i1.p1 TRINITY_DN16390_c0_g1~~TRINITY_DN16390_c0_g1_i1.p1  ORF type:complete len:233 (+),score=27.44 TRINITY_DN16390_c0_g1_i1:31-699(+)